MAPPAVGLFGKLPWEGDFIQRGLSARFVRPWDHWLSSALAASRDALGPASWPDAYLLSPPWSFLLEPGILGETGWAGVVASSVDKVGRFFPLTLVVELTAEQAALGQAASLRPLGMVMEQTALALIEAQHPVDDALAEASLRAQAALGQARAAWLYAPGRPDADTAGDQVLLAVGEDEAPLSALGATSAAAARSGWWHDRWAGHAPTAIACDGLPEAGRFAAFFDGAWDQRGWRVTTVEAQP